MAVTIGTTEFSNLTAQPFGYEAAETNRGLTARQWTITGLLTPSEWISLTNTYNAWRNTRITEPDSVESGSVGTTIALTATGPGDETWTAVPCWFADPPSGEQAGGWLRVSVRLVHAADKLEVLTRQAEDSGASDSELPDLGTITIGTGTLQLNKPIESFNTGPTLALTPGGVHTISGPLVLEEQQNIEGRGLLADWQAILAWYAATVVVRPTTGAWFPVSIPTATVESRLVEGARINEYTVSLVRARVI